MKALVFHRPGHVEEDVVVRVTSTAICGSDLHIYNGFFPQLKDMVLGHEFMGVIEETGSAVTNVALGRPDLRAPARASLSARAIRLCADGAGRRWWLDVAFIAAAASRSDRCERASARIASGRQRAGNAGLALAAYTRTRAWTRLPLARIRSHAHRRRRSHHHEHGIRSLSSPAMVRR